MNTVGLVDSPCAVSDLYFVSARGSGYVWCQHKSPISWSAQWVRTYVHQYDTIVRPFYSDLRKLGLNLIPFPRVRVSIHQGYTLLNANLAAFLDAELRAVLQPARQGVLAHVGPGSNPSVSGHFPPK